jgi:hypothetical protein
MSYPRKLHTLIVEDDAVPLKAYEVLFNRLVKEDKDGIATPSFAVSFSDAEKCLAGPNIYHVLILDMGLPPSNRLTAPDGVEHGLRLLELAAERDDYPIPVVLVISGRLGGSTDVPQIRRRIERSFFYGQFLNKGAEDKDAQIVRGMEKAREYCDVGIHIKDSPEELSPTLSPREHDLLRRCMCRNKSIGVDLEWWSAEDSGMRPDAPRWKKVLLGQFLLDGNMGRSNHVFFKFEPADDAPRVHSAAAVATHKFRHVKTVDSCSSNARSMLVTESVCAARPISIDQFLERDSAEVIPAIPQLVDDVVQQLEHLGTSTETPKPVNEILWPHFQDEMIRKAVERWMTNDLAKMANVEETYHALKANTTRVWIRTRHCNHGDLHAKNVAIDVGVTPVRAFIFDTGAMSPAVNVRDLALLEVTLLLFPPPVDDTSLVQACESLYGDSVEPPKGLDVTTGTSQVRNTKAFIAEVRRKALGLCEAPVYALSIFDHALMELAGMAFQSTRNKIAVPSDAARLAAMSAAWLRRVAPDWFSS